MRSEFKLVILIIVTVFVFLFSNARGSQQVQGSKSTRYLSNCKNKY